MRNPSSCLAGLRGVLCWVLPVLLLAGEAAGQTPRADKIHQSVGRIGAFGDITVWMKLGTQYYGSISRIGSDDFSVNDVDLHREVTIRYADINKVRAGYGSTRNIRGQRIHPRTRLIVSIAVIGGLIALVVIAVASDKS